MSDGDDIEAGRTAHAKHHTRIWATQGFGSPFIFIAEPSLSRDEGEGPPSTRMDGVIGVACSGTPPTTTSPPSKGGTGVIGKGGLGEGTGVLGLAGGATLLPRGTGFGVNATGIGGIGVHGIGGSTNGFREEEEIDAGVGVFGQGGRRDLNASRRAYGAGVVGISGGAGGWLPSILETGGVGVYGQGANADLEQTKVDGVSTVLGPQHPGCGVLGKGGVVEPAELGTIGQTIGAGVIGLAGGSPVPSIFEAAGSGVYGKGSIGVRGHGSGRYCGVLGLGGLSDPRQDPPVPGVIGVAGIESIPASSVAEGAGVLGTGRIGVRGVGNGDRGAVLSSDKAPQLRLTPGFQISVSNLQVEAKAGDLLVTSETPKGGVETATLWFCKVGGAPGNATWVKIV